MTEAPATLNPQAPHVGPLRRILGPLHYSSAFWSRCTFWLATRLPGWTYAAIAWLGVRVAYVSVPRVRAVLARNCERVHGTTTRGQRRRYVLATLTAFAWCLAERWQRLSGDAPFEVRFEGLEHWHSATEGDAGVLLVTAHVGMWEAASRLPSDTFDRHVHLVRERELDAGSQLFLEELLARDAATTYVTHFADEPTLGIDLMNAVRDGHLVALQGDRPRTGGRTLQSELFGAPFALPDGPAVLARVTGRPLLPVFALRTGRRSYRVVFGEPIQSPRTPDRAADNQVVADRFGAVLEEAIRMAPEQWFKFGG